MDNALFKRETLRELPLRILIIIGLVIRDSTSKHISGDIGAMYSIANKIETMLVFQEWLQKLLQGNLLYQNYYK